VKLSELVEILDRAGFPVDREGPDLEVEGVSTLELAGPRELSFLANPRYARAARRTRAGAVIARPGDPVAPEATVLRCADPYAAVTVSMIALHGYRRPPAFGRDGMARVDPTATVGPDVHLGPGVTVMPRARIGARSVLYPGCYVGEESEIGEDCVLHPGVVLYERCTLGDRVTVHAGTVIGEDGLGYAPVAGRWLKIPQVGGVRIGDDVEIGANCCIDRATLGVTEIGSGTKLGNAIVVGHGSRIGRDCLLVGQVGLAGSTQIGDRVTLAGHVGVVGHIRVGDGATVAAQSLVTEPVPDGATVMGTPALPVGLARRVAVAQARLPELLRRVRSLERELEGLRRRLGSAQVDPPEDGEDQDHR